MGEIVVTTSNRRSVIAAMGAGIALSGLGMPVRLAAKSGLVSFPSEPFILRRTLQRELGAGAALVVTRDWSGRFERRAAGARVAATQIACTVETPPVLAALAKVERERVVTGLFPMELGADGQIATWAQSQATGIEAALEAAERAIAGSTLDRGERRDARAYLASIGQTAADLVSQVPRDLFFPETGSRTETRQLKLPEGLTGSYEITVSAAASGPSGFLAHSERRIVTRIADSSRIALERWSIIG